ncbi:hypothetical protein SORBI_3003G404800 [Sorghum bicolor]|uniref:F-box domain-containing protein n=1 Tax=Sorghum bicolor TaxID=4558 RepID=A0A1W0W157_SORBI|nr:hypothetical protein SORBI_3003G404800 [Sorghum bicolor]
MIHTQPKRIRRTAAVPDFAGSSSHIPNDIIFFQILILLPVKCLVRLHSVCKSWRAAILSTHFIHCHLEHSRTRLSMVVMPRSSQPGQSKVAKLILQKRCPRGIPVFSMPLHCDGIILIPCTTGRIFLCNPTTREFVELPRGSCNVAGGA